MVSGESVSQYKTQGLTKQIKQASLRGQDPLREQRVPGSAGLLGDRTHSGFPLTLTLSLQGRGD